MSAQRCVQCGNALPDESHFCPNCGASLGGTLPVDPSSGPRGLWEVLLHRLRHAVAPRYEIDRLLGFGGMAGVYLARDTRLGRDVAIKVMSPSLMTDPSQVERFRQEARATAILSHPNIVTIHEIDESEGLQYLVMAYIEGRTLGTVLSEEPGHVPLERGARWIGQVARALHHAHGFGVVHRDIKPGNILIDGNDTALVTDFGIAKVGDEPGLTRTGMIVGTPTYMSPEQCRSGEISGASDQYSLGILAHHVLVGSPPFTGDTMAVLHQHVSEPPEPLAERHGDCPAHLAEAIDRALAKDPAERWPTMEAFIAALEDRTVPAAAQPPSSSRPMEGAAGARSTRALAAIWLGGGGVAAAAMVAGGLLLWGPPGSDPDAATPPATPGSVMAPAAPEPDEDVDAPEEPEVPAADEEDRPPPETAAMPPPPEVDPEPTTGTLAVMGSLPPGSRIMGQGPDGERPIPLQGGLLEAGPWLLVVEAEGYETLEATVDVVAGERVEWVPELVAESVPEEPPPEDVDVEPEPPVEAEPDLGPLRQEVAETLSRFAEAFESRSMASVLALYPEAPSEWQEEYRVLVENTDNIRNLSVEVERVDHVVTTEDQAQVTFVLAVGFNDYRNQPQTQAIPFAATLEPTPGGVWLIIALHAFQ